MTTRNATPATGARWPPLSIASRVAAAILGGYVFTWGITALGSMALVWLGAVRSEAVMSATMLGFVAYLLVALWAFAARQVGHVWLALSGGGILMTALAHWAAGGR